jgi:small subunit ribosomal protein S4
MGDPRKTKSKFSKPMHPWQKDRIEEEKALAKDYGFKNRREIWKLKTLLRNFYSRAKKIIATKTTQGEKEKIQLLTRLKSLGILNENADIEEVLGITLTNLMDRRLQSIVFKKSLARSMKQARQFITHGHIMVAGEKINAPGYLVLKKDNESIVFSPNSSLVSEDHPERVIKKEVSLVAPKKEAKEEKGAKKEEKPRNNPKKENAHKPKEKKVE